MNVTKMGPYKSIVVTFAHWTSSSLVPYSNNLISETIPKWFTPNCMSKPSSVFHEGHRITPALFISMSTRCSSTIQQEK